MTISEKVSYLKGLADGLDIDTETKEGKLFSVIIDVLDEIADKLEEIEENALDIAEEIDAMSDDLADVEEIVFDEDDECCCCDDDDDECCCEDAVLYAVTCPECENEITVDEDVLGLGEIDCPNCGAKLEFDLDSIECDDDDECCCEEDD